MKSEDLEKIMKEKVKPIIDEAISSSIGIKISELSKDLTKKLRNPYFDFIVDANIPFKEAKKLFKKMYVERLLSFHFGDVSAVARAAGVDRRSVHRIIKETGIDVNYHRKMMLKPQYAKSMQISSIIEGIIKNYEEIINPKKISIIYESVPKLSNDILNELPVQDYLLKDAETDFEREYFKKALEQNNWNKPRTAGKVGLRYETLHRKMRELRINRG